MIQYNLGLILFIFLYMYEDGNGGINRLSIRDSTRYFSRVDPGGAPGALPPKIGKNMIFWHKIMIFHTKYPKRFKCDPP